MNKKQYFIVNENDTLLNSIFLFKKDLSKNSIKDYIKNKMVMVNDNVITNSSYLVNKGDNVTIYYNKRYIKEVDLDILYEDDYLIIINKPSGLLSISNEKEKEITAYRMVSDYVKKNNKKKYIFVVHRLDEDTSGVLMFCKDQKIRDYMQENWNTLVKYRGYMALVEGKFNGNGTIHTYLREDKRQFVYSSKSGKEAITNYNFIKGNKDYSLMEVKIDTGRRNQIRVHFSEMGHPIVGDKKYASKMNPIKRLCLHAYRLDFIHPVSKKMVSIKCEYPKEFDKLING